MYILPFTLFGSLLPSREVSSTTFCIVEKTLYLLYRFSGVHLGTRAAGEQEASLRTVQYIYKLLASSITS